MWLVGGGAPLIKSAVRRAWKLAPGCIVVIKEPQLALARELILFYYLNPEEDAQDAQAMQIIGSVPLRSRGEFFRAALVGGSALYQLDKRIPFLVTMLFDGRLTADQLVSIIQQSTGWQPSTASIREVNAAYGSDVPASGGGPVDEVSQESAGQARNNFRRMVKKT